MIHGIQTDNSISLNEAVHDNVMRVTNICYQLESLSNAFNRVGNDKVSEELYDMIYPLLQSAKQVSSSYSIELSKRVQKSQEDSINMLKAVVAGIEIGKKD